MRTRRNILYILAVVLIISTLVTAAYQVTHGHYRHVRYDDLYVMSSVR